MRNKTANEFDVVVLNAGIMPFDEEEQWEKIHQINLGYVWEFLTLQHKQKQFVKRGGSIILNASVSGTKGCGDMPYYASLKGALINMCKSYAFILMHQDIRVNCFSPGFFRTNLVPGDTPQDLIDNIPMKREAEPVELCPIVDALIDCKYITGQNIIVDGGLSL